MTLLEIESVTKRFSGLTAVDAASFDVAPGDLLGLIGPNGSGKTTLINLMSGHLDGASGSIRLRGRELLGEKPYRIARLGILRMFQMTRIFRNITAFDNLLVVGRSLGLGADAARQRAESLFAELKLEHAMHLDAGQLSGGQQKLLEFGTCFMAPPEVALLDEPFAAVHPTMRETLAGFVRRRHAEGQTFILVSHDMPIIRELCPRSVCMNAGRILAEGPTEAVLKNPDVIEAYLGGEAA